MTRRHRPVPVHVDGVGPQQQQHLVATTQYDVRRRNHLKPIHAPTLVSRADKPEGRKGSPLAALGDRWSGGVGLDVAAAVGGLVAGGLDVTARVADLDITAAELDVAATLQGVELLAVAPQVLSVLGLVGLFLERIRHSFILPYRCCDQQRSYRQTRVIHKPGPSTDTLERWPNHSSSRSSAPPRPASPTCPLLCASAWAARW